MTKKDLKVNLTDKEFNLVKIFLSENGCGARTPVELLSDNFSCQCIEDLRDFTKKSPKELGGILSSLQTKGIINLDDRDGPICTSKKRADRLIFEPDLYWIDEDFLKELDPELQFWD